jgi:hypothetical protein
MIKCDFCFKELKESYYLLVPNMKMCQKCHDNCNFIIGNEIKHIENRIKELENQK